MSNSLLTSFFGVLILIRGMPLLASDADPGSAIPAAEQDAVSAAALVKAMYESRAWVDRAQSFYIRVERIIANSDQEDRRQSERPQAGFGLPGSKPPKLSIRTEEWAWDTTRIYYSDQWRNGGLDTRSWDGKLAVSHSRLPNGEHEQYVLGNKAGQFFEALVKNTWSLPWGPAGNHRFWWLPIDVDKSRADRYLAPDDFELVGDETVNDRDCHVLEARAGHMRLFIGKADGRLYRRTWYVVSQATPGYDYLAICRKIGDDQIKTIYHWQPWLESLEPAERRRAWRDLAVAQFEFARPRIRETLDDYREVAPSCWLPFRRTDDTYATQEVEPHLQTHSTVTVDKVRVNQPLLDDLFEFELKDGVPVATDWRYDPPIRYTYRKDQTEAERLSLRDKAKEEQAEAKADMERRETVIRSRIGKAPPPLPKTGWLKGEPLSWDKLRGKVIVLHFWDVSCAPCQNELPILANWHETGDDSAIVVIGVHPTTEDLNAVRKKLAEFGIEYPVLIDTPSEKGNGLGFLHDWFGNTWWPHTVLINKRGLIAGHGQVWFGDIADQMRKLAAEED